MQTVEREAAVLAVGGLVVLWYSLSVAPGYPSPWNVAHFPAVMLALPLLAGVVYRRKNRLGMSPAAGAILAGLIILGAVLYPLVRFGM